MHRMKFPLVTVAFAAAFQLFGAASASAHHIDLVATGVCEAETLRISFTATSGTPFAEGNHNNIAVLFNSVQVGTYAFTQAQVPPNTFSDTLDSPVAGGGTVVVTATAVGPWVDGSTDAASASVTVTLPTDCGGTTTPGVGRFTGGGNTVAVGDIKFTRGFTIHCDLILSNNLEINWPAAAGRQNQFHMLEHTAADCTDDPTIEQRPPHAPVDTIVGEGTGRFNGVDGYSITFTLVDAGEPGTSDRIGFTITAPGGGVVVNLPVQNITGGNVQAHFDQPHRSNP